MFLNKSPWSRKTKDFDSTHKYKNKHHVLKNYILSLVYENAALCDQITYLQDKILYIKEETNFLTRKLKHIEFIKSSIDNDVNNEMNFKKMAVRRKISVTPVTPDNPLRSPLKLKKPVNKNMNKKKQTLTVSEEACGQITFPIAVGDDLSIQCLGEIIFDRSTFHVDDMIYPVGYISRKIYASTRNPKLKCIYTCKIIDAGLFPRFEIRTDDGPVFAGSSPNEAHQKLLSRINNNYPVRVVNDSSHCGDEFFGLTNSTVHYLILSLPGASKCVKYNFKKFSEKIAAKDDVLVKDDIEACINYSALQKVLPESYNRDNFVTDTDYFVNTTDSSLFI